MPLNTIRIGIIGLGANTRLRHVPGFRACAGVEIAAVCNRTPESTRRAADEFHIPRVFDDWRQLVESPEIDAVMIGTWPYLHCPITLAALDAGKHVLTEARMAMNVKESRAMLAASQRHPNLITQVVPSPFGLRAHRVVQDLLGGGFIGKLREVVVIGTNDALADPNAPLHWRQLERFSGVNMLTLGILHETVTRWIPQPSHVIAQTHTFTPERRDAETGKIAAVETPDNVRVLTELPDNACGLYHFSGAVHSGPGMQIHLYGSEGSLKYLLAPEDRLMGTRRGDNGWREIEVPREKQLEWRVEKEFICAIRGEEKIEFTDFASGVRYMEFTEAVSRSAASGTAVDLSSS